MHARLPFAIGLLVLLASPMQAQEMSDEELLQRFERQRDAFETARSSSLGATRGLKLITVDDLATDPDVAAATPAEQPPAQADALPAGAAAGEGRAAVASQAAGSPATTIIAAGNAPATNGAASSSAPPLLFGRLDPELQVNVRITFPFDSAMLTDDQLPKLAQLCRVMRSSSIGLFRIVGHTDAAGTDLYNERLSLLRAEEVRRYLIESCQMPAERLEAVGLGERILFDPADPRAPENRRVELQALS